MSIDVPESKKAFLDIIEAMTHWPEDLVDPVVRASAVKHLPGHVWPNHLYSVIGLLRIGVEKTPE